VLELDAELAQSFVFTVNVVRLKVQRYLLGHRNLVNKVDRERAVAGGALKPQVVLILDDERESELRVEAFGRIEVHGADGHLIESHGGQSSIGRHGSASIRVLDGLGSSGTR
jgi:hypothetical protein